VVVVAALPAAELARDVVVLAPGPAAAVALLPRDVVVLALALLRAARLLAATTWLRRVLAALLVAEPPVVAPLAPAAVALRVARLALPEVARVQPVELRPSFSAATARTTRQPTAPYAPAPKSR
jgi:hypothetical protein